MNYVTLDPSDAVGAAYKTGVDVQYKLSNGLTALAAANPDFKQIEDVVDPISFSYTERYRPDLRPFFVTGQEGFLPKEHLLYTRRIEKFDAGFKLFGTVGDETIGVMEALSYGEQNALAAAWRHRFDDHASAKLLVVSDTRMGELGSAAGSLAYGLDASHTWRNPMGEDGIWGVAYQSKQRDGTSGLAYQTGGYHERGGGHIWYNWYLRSTQRDFNPSLGYYPDVNNRGGSFNIGQWDRMEKGPIEMRNWSIRSEYYRFHDTDGNYRAAIAPSFGFGWRNGRALQFGLTRGRQFGWDASDMFTWLGWNQKDLYRRGGMTLVRGKRAGGDYSYLSFDQGFRPTDKVSLRLAFEQFKLVDAVDYSGRSYQAVLTSSYDLTQEKTLAARLIWRDTGMTAYAAYRQVVRRGVDAYVILGDPDPARTGFTPRLAVKLIRTM
jgi:hypothetical protein